MLTWAAVERPRAVSAQQSNSLLIGYLCAGEPKERAPSIMAFKEGLKELGFVEGRNVAIEYRWAEDHYDRLPALAADLVNRRVTVLTAADVPSALAAKTATRTIPIAFQTGADALQSGLVKRLDTSACLHGACGIARKTSRWPLSRTIQVIFLPSCHSIIHT